MRDWGWGGEGEEEIEGREKERERLTFLLLFGTVNIIKILGNFRKTKGALEKAKLYVASGCYSLVQRQPGGSINFFFNLPFMVIFLYSSGRSRISRWMTLEE